MDAAESTKLARRLLDASGGPTDWDIPGLLVDAHVAICEMRDRLAVVERERDAAKGQRDQILRWIYGLLEWFNASENSSNSRKEAHAKEIFEAKAWAGVAAVVRDDNEHEWDRFAAELAALAPPAEGGGKC